MHTGSPATQGVHDIVDGLAEAAAAAGYAPSIHDTQPWRWRLATETLDLYLQRGRVLDITDPDARLATVSCGAALHHARTVLAAAGWRASVARMPDAADQEHLAQVRVFGPAGSDPTAIRHLRAIPLRHTNRSAVTGAPVAAEDVRAIAAAVQAEGGWMQLLSADQVLALAAAAELAQRSEAGALEWRTDLSYWAGGSPPGAPISAQHDRSALFGILHGRSDEPRDWLRAGEALSAAWLTATERGTSVLPISAPVEVGGTREAMRRILSYLSHPFLVLRLGAVDPAAAVPRSPRRPKDQLVEAL
jgi:nitroreductase